MLTLVGQLDLHLIAALRIDVNSFSVLNLLTVRAEVHSLLGGLRNCSHIQFKYLVSRSKYGTHQYFIVSTCLIEYQLVVILVNLCVADLNGLIELELLPVILDISLLNGQ